MRAILGMTAALAMAAVAAAGTPVEARTHKPHLHAPRIRAARSHKVRAPRSAYRTVRVRRADGTVMTGYQDGTGTHLHGPDGRSVHCQRQIGAADIDVACC